MIKIKSNDHGVSIWSNGKWIVDASTFLSSGRIAINTKRFDIQDKGNGNLELCFKDLHEKCPCCGKEYS